MMAVAEPLPLPPNVGLEQDPDIYLAVKRLALTAIDAAIDILDSAAPAQQAIIIRILLPRLTSALRTAPEDDKGELRASVTAIFDKVREAIDPIEDPSEVAVPDA